MIDVIRQGCPRLACLRGTRDALYLALGLSLADGHGLISLLAELGPGGGQLLLGEVVEGQPLDDGPAAVLTDWSTLKTYPELAGKTHLVN